MNTRARATLDEAAHSVREGEYERLLVSQAMAGAALPLEDADAECKAEASERAADPRQPGSGANHEQLRKRAVQWLTNTKHCGVVLSEMVSGAREIPDAIGWKYGQSHVVECKVSRSDWRANGDKPVERAENGVGKLRYILCPSGLIQPEEIQDGWGLLWWSLDSVNLRLKKEPAPRESNQSAEIVMLVSALRRVRAREFLVLVPETPQLPPKKEEPYA